MTAVSEDVVADLGAEEERLAGLLGGLSEEQWAAASGCEGWSVADVVLHLAQTEEAVASSFAGVGWPGPVPGSATSIDDVVNHWVEVQRGAVGADVLARWEAARLRALELFRTADPDVAVPWAASPLKPRTLATTRLAEHWAHTLDIAGPLGLPVEDTDRLAHIARLAHRTLPYAFTRAGETPPGPVRFDLTGPDGQAWEFGEHDAPTTISGPAGQVCRIAARRLEPADASDVHATGPDAARVLALVRTYA